MKKTVILSFFVLLTTGIFAQTKFGHVGSELILSMMPETKTVQGKLDSLQVGFQEQYNSELKSYEELMAKYEKMKTDGASQTMLRITEDELLAKQQLIQKLPTVYEEEMYEKQQLLMEPILKRLQTAVNEVAKEKGLNYIFDSGKGMLLYADTSDDITQDVKAKLGIK